MNNVAQRSVIVSPSARVIGESKPMLLRIRTSVGTDDDLSTPSLDSTLPGGAECGIPRGDSEEPTWSMQPQMHPTGSVPSDEILVKSLYKQLLKDRWELRFKPGHDYPEEYVLPRSLTGNTMWIQRADAFFREHGEISEEEVYVANRRNFLAWIERRFCPATSGICGATEDLCFIVGNYVFWVDRAANR
ncbi:hypothetical protein F5Y08DRAFT_339942 [Xylaria arbuscula]|uniref:Uncharacterized protein n=1 Tax=Xylaria arbuscula TaxID=114810 RepID=A0A9W8TP08_9PEZI|nr:hypothetical protein F5Y08DRAFT_339942 [Xylaria arbuscula]KAJ3578437.1 hypothetical protein NPX13_g2127 [Xylaria arbuscula]